MARYISMALAVLGIVASVSTPSFLTVRSQTHMISTDRTPAGSCPVIDARDDGTLGAAGRSVAIPERQADSVGPGGWSRPTRQGC